MTWQAWVGAVLFYGGIAVVIGAAVVIAWDAWRTRTCRDVMAIGGRPERCVLMHHHDGPHRGEGRYGPQWERTGGGHCVVVGGPAAAADGVHGGGHGPRGASPQSGRARRGPTRPHPQPAQALRSRKARPRLQTEAGHSEQPTKERTRDMSVKLEVPKKRSPKAERALLTQVKRHWRLMLCEVYGELWWTNSFMAARCTPDMAGLLSDYNLPAEPMACDVGRTIVRRPRALPELASIVKGATVGADTPIWPLTFGSDPLIVERGEWGTAELWTRDGKSVSHTFSREYLAMLGPHSEVRCSPDAKPAVCMDEKGKPCGLIMPIRTDSTLFVPEAAPDLEASAA